MHTAIVTTARALSAAQRKKIEQALEKKYGKGAYTLQEKIDDTIIGGVKLVVDSAEYDATISGKLLTVKDALSQA